MKRYLGVLIPAVGFIVSAGIAAWLIGVYAPWYRLPYLVQTHEIVLRLVIALILCLLIAVLVVGARALVDRRGRFNRELLALALAPVLPAGLEIYNGVQGSRYFLINSNIVTFADRAPPLIEASSVAAFAFFVAALAMSFRLLGGRGR
ncbi:hypothetical protein [Brevundimonas sp. GCM10030266]|uniref:hypothetical protein n=1 Tax=Brevundimonas sp. GCM10030266 TaxID=3273386 RepID=UPI0036092CD0